MMIHAWNSHFESRILVLSVQFHHGRSAATLTRCSHRLNFIRVLLATRCQCSSASSVVSLYDPRLSRGQQAVQTKALGIDVPSCRTVVYETTTDRS